MSMDMLVDTPTTCQPTCWAICRPIHVQYTSWHLAGWYGEYQPPVEYQLTIGGISVDYHTIIYNLCFKIRMGKLGFSVAHEILQFGGLIIVSVLLFVSSHVSLAESTCRISMVVLACFNVTLSQNTSQRWWHSSPNFFQKIADTLTSNWKKYNVCADLNGSIFQSFSKFHIFMQVLYPRSSNKVDMSSLKRLWPRHRGVRAGRLVQERSKFSCFKISTIQQCGVGILACFPASPQLVKLL